MKNNIIKNASMIVIIAIILNITSIFAMAADEVFSITTDNTDVNVGDTVSIKINLKKTEKIRGIQFDVNYDSDSLEYKSSEDAEWVSDAFIYQIDKIKDGKIRAIYAFSEEYTIDGDICTINFNVKSTSVKQVTIAMSGISVTGLVPNEAVLSINVKDGKTSNNNGGSSNNGSSEKPTTSPEVTNPPTISPTTSPDIQPTPTSTAAPIISFNDIKGHWAEENIQYLADLKLVNGVSENIFEPDRSITRAEFAKLISNLLKIETTSQSEFTDVNKDNWFYDSVTAMASEGIVKGADGLFRPNDVITREEMAVIIARAYTKAGLTTADGVTLEKYTDFNEVSEWSKDSISKMIGNGMLSGMSETEFGPKSNTTRAQAATVIKRLYDKIG